MISRLLHNRRLQAVFWDARTIAPISADQDNWDLGDGATYNISASAEVSISGFANPGEGRWINLVNIGSEDILFLNEDTGSTANYRILTGLTDGASVRLRPNQEVSFEYSNALQRWVLQRVMTDIYNPITDPLLVCLTGGDGIRRVLRGDGLIGDGTNKQESRYTTADQTISSTSYADLTGTSITFDTPSCLLKINGRVSAYGEVSRNGTTYGLANTWRGVITLDVDGSDYVIGMPSGAIAADISSGVDLDTYMLNGSVVSGFEAIPLDAGSHTIKLKAKKFNSGDANFVVRGSTSAPRVLTAIW